MTWFLPPPEVIKPPPPARILPAWFWKVYFINLGLWLAFFNLIGLAVLVLRWLIVARSVPFLPSYWWGYEIASLIFALAFNNLLATRIYRTLQMKDKVKQTQTLR